MKRDARLRVNTRPWKRARVAPRAIARPLYLRPETKVFPLTFSQSFTDTGAALGLSDIAEGIDTPNRIGKRVMVKRIQIRASVRETGTASFVRICLMRVRGLYTGTITDYLPTYRTAPTNDRAYIVWDHFTFLGLNGDSSLDINKDFKVNTLLRFNGANGSDEQDGSYVLIVMADADHANDPKIEGYSRCWFTDV